MKASLLRLREKRKKYSPELSVFRDIEPRPALFIYEILPKPQSFIMWFLLNNFLGTKGQDDLKKNNLVV